ncbi:hypothetical protein SELMODRAFT_90610 [Selaginella moellendorffii]|uniref:cysteine synthase n=1 Tax=Selaginella moellendorffii TaxID=88036 RepID=D8RCH3_SELML|nr:cysteine synthase 2 [Selaginella moellendorffii]EFJ30131.1 hypothetical protein SELMODRAFT_90610 [Selaginella moellendorffii]|eukprot:XP_002969015.1 cysteine synthase 2 [Selaginella moellendorffii]
MRKLAIAVVISGGALVIGAIAIVSSSRRRRRRRSSQIVWSAAHCDRQHAHGILGAVGNTPLVRIRSLSEATGCEIYAKAEFLNPGGSIKDRVAVKVIKEALQSGKLRPGGVVTEGSAGSTAISLAMVAVACGCKCHVVIPDDAAIEKAQLLEALGATVERVRPVSITHKDHFVNIARRRAQEAEAKYKERMIVCPFDKNDKNQTKNGTHNVDSKDEAQGGYFADQFENLANFRAHYQGTGPEIWKQTGGKVDAFVAASGTGGTIAGITCYLKDQRPEVKCYLIDPPGSGLYNRVSRGVLYAREEAEGKRLKNPFDTITEGIGINRLTKNFLLAKLDGAIRGTDKEAVEMSRFLLREDGIFVGSSSAMNCVGAVRVARLLGPGHTIVTILCDSGSRHLSKFYNAEYLSTHGLLPTAKGLEFLV